MIDTAPVSGQSAADFLPAQRPAPLHVLQEAAKSCRGCPLHEAATCTVFGRGPADARIMLVGEQPGDEEDRAGMPFVGPAGRVLDRALSDAGLDRSTLYITNAVKHFKWTTDPTGKRRIHSKPGIREIVACRPWLEQEIGAVAPGVIVLLGATAAQSLLGPGFRITKDRGTPLRNTRWAPTLIATFHPSAILRTPDPDSKTRLYDALVADLASAASHAATA
ncbi:MAG: UdgX family uracil-DNA binding protein [Thermoleophilia bacterium]|nr:UdgX family uracil-DNA binding protein [Thermoleophilia bacterium]